MDKKITKEELKLLLIKSEKEKWIFREYIKKYEKYSIPYSILIEQWEDIKKFKETNPRDSSSRKSFLVKYGNEYGEELFLLKTEKTKNNRERLTLKYGNQATEKLSLRGSSLENFIKRHGTELGTLKWEKYLEKRKLAYIHNRLKGKVYAKYTEKYYQNLYGIAEGSKRFKEKIEKQRYKVSRQRYIDEYGNDGIEICREIKDHLSIKYFKKKYGEEIGKLKYEEYHKSKPMPKRGYYSKWSISIIKELLEYIPDLIYYGDNEKAFNINNKSFGIKSRVLFVDLCYNKKIIEFNGDKFHGNPNIFNENDCPHPFKKDLPAKEMWDRDKRRYEYIKSLGYEILIIWENDDKNREELIKKCITFLKN